MPIKPYAPRHWTDNQGDTLYIHIPSRKEWFIILFTGAWLVGWAFGEITVLKFLFPGRPFAGPILFITAWMVLWTLGGLYAIYILLWQLFGKELIAVSNQAIIVNRVIFGLKIPREYDASHIRGLRISTLPEPADLFGFYRATRVTGFSGGLIAFDYGAKTIRFGMGIDEAEARQILTEITQVFWRYRNSHNY